MKIFQYNYSYSDDGRYNDYFFLKKVNGERFTLEELKNIIPDFEDLLLNNKETLEFRLENLKKILEKLQTCAK